jgi:hypothetical protein
VRSARPASNGAQRDSPRGARPDRTRESGRAHPCPPLPPLPLIPPPLGRLLDVPEHQLLDVREAAVIEGRYGRFGTKAAELRRAVHELLIEHEHEGELPTSNRFLFYELRQRGGPLYGHKSRRDGRSEDQNLSAASTWLRDRGLVPWTWIEDETRSLTAYRYAGTVAAYLADSIDAARVDCWGGEPPPLIICESRTFGGVLRRTLAADYLCPVTATNGQVGGFLHTNVVPILGNGRRVLYVGDLDLAGDDIEQNTRRVLVREAGERDWRRIALTAEQAEGRHLPTVEKVDRRFDPPRRHEAIEVEALGQGTVTAIIREALDALLPAPLERVQVREAGQREAVAGFLARWDGAR